jgi:hypothetical protein
MSAKLGKRSAASEGGRRQRGSGYEALVAVSDCSYRIFYRCGGRLGGLGQFARSEAAYRSIQGVGSFLVKEYNRSRERVEHRRGLLREAHKDLIHSYNEIKHLRRLLRAQAMHPTYHDPQAVVYRDSYGPLLERLSEAQLQLEDYVRRIRGNHDIYSDAQDLVENLNRAENYVGNLITEWEDNLGLFQGDPPQRTLTRLPALGCFLGDAKTAFKPCIADPMATVLDALSRAIAACV